MTYDETIDYLFNATPLFQNVGGDAYKEGLSNTHLLDKHFGCPHRRFKTVHVAGTNGKGSCSHTIAAILQSSGLKVGLFTSPHLVDFRERIRVNGVMIDKDYVVKFVADEREFFEPLHPSFFELTTALAFKYFAEQQVDVAVIEVGLGGRLDCTNIIMPEVCVITNISFDHVQYLGNTLSEIAGEKAGIIKQGVPVVIGETVEETHGVFADTANRVGAPIVFAEESDEVLSYTTNTEGGFDYVTKSYGEMKAELGGFCQVKNTNTILHAVEQLRKRGFGISDADVRQGFANVCKMTGLMGRWQTLRRNPRVVADTGHNIGGFLWIVKQLEACRQQLPVGACMRIVFGMVNDKDITGVLSMMPTEAKYYFTEASVKRALPCTEIQSLAANYGLLGNAYSTVAEAYTAALQESSLDDFIYIGGSSFVVGDMKDVISLSL